MRSVNQAGLRLLKHFEGFRAQPYEDVSGVWTIGYGHTQGVGPDTGRVDECGAETLLRTDIAAAEQAVCRLVSVPLGDNQYAALVSLVFNAGHAPLRKMLGAMLNDGDYAGAADQFLRWRLAGGMVSDGLVRRRNAERRLFLLPDAADPEIVFSNL